MGESPFLILPRAIGDLCFSIMPRVPRLRGHPLQTLQPENLDRILTPGTCKKCLNRQAVACRTLTRGPNTGLMEEANCFPVELKE